MKQLRALFYGGFERQMLEPVQGIVVDKRAHGPEEGHRFPGHVDHGAYL